MFAKGTLEEGGFAWRVAGAVQGYPANTVVSQVPAAGTRVVDTGMPTIQLGLARNGSYAQEGAPENTSPYDGTAIKLPGRPKPAAKPKPRPKPVAKPRPKPKAARSRKPKTSPSPPPSGGLPGRRRTRRAARRGAADDPSEAPRALACDAPQADHCERQSLALPAPVDRDRRAVRLVARRPGPRDPDPGRRAGAAPVEHRFQERSRREARARRRAREVAMTRLRRCGAGSRASAATR